MVNAEQIKLMKLETEELLSISKLSNETAKEERRLWDCKYFQGRIDAFEPVLQQLSLIKIE